MLPFLKPRQIGAVMIAKKSDQGIQDQHSETEYDPGLHAAMEDFSRAHGSKDVEGMVRSLSAAFDILSSRPDVGQGEK